MRRPWRPGRTLATGLVLGGMYALVAMGLTLQYGVARIMNLANGEMLVAGAFGHPRFQQFIFGGATRTLMQADAGPSLFLSH